MSSCSWRVLPRVARTVDPAESRTSARNPVDNGASYPGGWGVGYRLNMSDVTIDLAPSASPRSATDRTALLQNPGFGQVFTDHMVGARYSPDEGWHDARLTAYGPLTLDPATSALHYGQAIFEGLKAYHQPDGSVALFRPEPTPRRSQPPARRLAMAEVPEELFLGAVEALVSADRDWVPSGEGQALYLRPLEFALDPFLGVRPSREYQFLLFASPAGAYFPGGVQPVTV